MGRTALDLLKEELSYLSQLKKIHYFPADFFGTILYGSFKEALKNEENGREFTEILEQVKNILIPSRIVPQLIYPLRFFYVNLWNKGEVNDRIAELFNKTMEVLLGETYNVIKERIRGTEIKVEAATTSELVYPVEKLEFLFLNQDNSLISFEEILLNYPFELVCDEKTGICEVCYTVLIFRGNYPAEFPLPVVNKCILLDRKDVFCFLVLDGSPYVSFPLKFGFNEIIGRKTQLFATTLPRDAWTNSHKRLSFVIKKFCK